MTGLSHKVWGGVSRGGIPGETACPRHEQRLCSHTMQTVTLQSIRLRLTGRLGAVSFQPGKEARASI